MGAGEALGRGWRAVGVHPMVLRMTALLVQALEGEERRKGEPWENSLCA